MNLRFLLPSSNDPGIKGFYFSFSGDVRRQKVELFSVVLKSAYWIIKVCIDLRCVPISLEALKSNFTFDLENKEPVWFMFPGRLSFILKLVLYIL